jgi:hypothetical protein
MDPINRNSVPIVKASSFTASNSKVYHVTATATVTDPAGVEGQGFEVLVLNGTVTVGGSAFDTQGQVVQRVYRGGAWYVYAYPTLAGGTIPLAQLPASVKDDLVTADATDPTPGTLNDKVDNATLDVDTTGHKIRVKALGIANAQVATSAAIAWSKIDKTGAVAGDVGAQASDTDLTALAGFTGTSVIPERTGSGTWAERTITATGRTWLQGQDTNQTKTANYTLTTADSGSIIDNLGSVTANIEMTLPTAARGLRYTIVCADSDGIRFRAPASTVIYNGTAVTTAAGYIGSTTIGSTLTIACVDAASATKVWMAVSSVGTWTAA